MSTWTVLWELINDKSLLCVLIILEANSFPSLLCFGRSFCSICPNDRQIDVTNTFNKDPFSLAFLITKKMIKRRLFNLMNYDYDLIIINYSRCNGISILHFFLNLIKRKGKVRKVYLEDENCVGINGIKRYFVDVKPDTIGLWHDYPAHERSLLTLIDLPAICHFSNACSICQMYFRTISNIFNLIMKSSISRLW